MATKPDPDFHYDFERDYYLRGTAKEEPSGRLVKKLTPNYRFQLHEHPYVRELIKELVDNSVPGLQAMDTKNTDEKLPNDKPKPELYETIFSANRYNPNHELVDDEHQPVKDLDFEPEGAYSVYNWELFFHALLTTAVHLSKNQRFEEAQRWFHYIFDPTDGSDGPTPSRFWKCKPFQTTDIQMATDILINLATGKDLVLLQRTVDSIKQWQDKPFRPHVIARYRQSAYMFKTVMAYLDNLIAWGDTLFRQDTRETNNEATQIYVLAANLLGPRPQAVPPKGSVRPQTYSQLREQLNKSDEKFGAVIVDVEADLPLVIDTDLRKVSDTKGLITLRSLGRTLYFCAPPNDKLLGYWDTVADRLFKIRNSLNIQGVFRQLPLFEPPIDPALLARAAAAGLDVGAIVSGLNQPLPLVRYRFLVQKAAEICQEVKTLGNHLLSAIEKEDNEALAVLRARHERKILGLVETLKYAQWQETIKAREGLEKSFDIAFQRYTYYERVLGEQEEEIEKKKPKIDDQKEAKKLKKELTAMNFEQSDPTDVRPRSIEVDIAEGGPGEMRFQIQMPGIPGLGKLIRIPSIKIKMRGDTGGSKVSGAEAHELNLMEAAQGVEDFAAKASILGNVLAVIPTVELFGMPLGVGASAEAGGLNLAKAAELVGQAGRALANRLDYEASRARTLAKYDRREQKWAFKSSLAAGEMNQIIKQLRAAQIREYIAEKEFEDHKEKIKQADQIENFLKGEYTPVGDKKHRKTSTHSFYTWMKREVKGLYGDCFQFAFDIAKKAERALQHELGDTELRFLEFGYLAGKEGLLAGEKLYLDIKRMEMAYYELNQREYELTKHVSLLQVDPHALMSLRATGNCEVSLPEEVFDMDCPGHYFRRIKSVAISIPCVTGPYTSVNCTLTLLKSSIRKESSLAEDKTPYVRQSSEDSRFSDHFGAIQSIVTSTAQNDSGLFETNLHDERYLPFEGCGAVSSWRIELPSELRQFNYDTISDAILHMRYTAREGGAPLRQAAISHLEGLIKAAQATGSQRLFSVRHEFPTAWVSFKATDLDVSPVAALTLELREEHYPFWSGGRFGTVTGVQLFFDKPDKLDVFDAIDDQGNPTGNSDKLEEGTTFGDLKSGSLSEISLPNPTGKFTLYFDDNSMQDLWLMLTLTWNSREA